MKIVWTKTAKTLFKNLVITIVVILLMSSGCVRFISWLEYNDVDKTPSVSSRFKEEDLYKTYGETKRERIKNYYKNQLLRNKENLEGLKKQHPKNPWISSKLKKYNKHIESFLSHEFLLPTESTCSRCNGKKKTGKLWKTECTRCHGTGKEEGPEHKYTGEKIVNPTSYY